MHRKWRQDVKMCGAFTRGLLKSENSTASNAGKEKQKREAPRKASPHSEENPGKSRKMNLYNQQCHPEQAGQRSMYPGPERHMKGCVPRPRIWFQGAGDSGVSHLRQCVSKTIYCHSVAPTAGQSNNGSRRCQHGQIVTHTERRQNEYCTTPGLYSTITHSESYKDSHSQRTNILRGC